MAEGRRSEGWGFLFRRFGRDCGSIELLQVPFFLSRIWVELHYKAPNYYELSFYASYLSPGRLTSSACITSLPTFFHLAFRPVLSILTLFFFSTVFHIQNKLNSDTIVDTPVRFLSLIALTYQFFSTFPSCTILRLELC